MELAELECRNSADIHSGLEVKSTMGAQNGIRTIGGITCSKWNKSSSGISFSLTNNVDGGIYGDVDGQPKKSWGFKGTRVMIKNLIMFVMVIVMNGYKPDDRSLRCSTLKFSVLKNML